MILPDIKACGHRNIERNCSSVLLTYKCKYIKGDSNGLKLFKLYVLMPII